MSFHVDTVLRSNLGYSEAEGDRFTGGPKTEHQRSKKNVSGDVPTEIKRVLESKSNKKLFFSRLKQKYVSIKHNNVVVGGLGAGLGMLAG